MRKLTGWALAAIAALGMAAPANAKEHSPEVIASLECAALYSFAVGLAETDLDKARTGILVGYFVGKTIGLEPDIDIKEAFNPAFVQSTIPKFQSITDGCTKEAVAFGTDLKAAGDVLKDSVRKPK